MVAGALPGELVEVQAEGERARIIEARTRAVIEHQHQARELDPCPHAPTCGGCDWPHVLPEPGAALKAEAAAGAARGSKDLASMLAAAPVRVSPPAYRLRARLHWCNRAKILGFYRRKTHAPSRISDCRLVSPALSQALPALEAALAQTCPARIDIDWLEELDGSCRIIGLRPAEGGPAGIKVSWLPGTELLSGAVDGAHTIDPRGEPLHGWGPSAVVMKLPISLRVPVGAFFQGNRHLVPWLFERVASLCGQRPVPTWDLHAGVGFLAAAAAHASARELMLAETFVPAARAAQQNLPAASIEVGSSAENMLARHRPRSAEALVLADPPRAGLSRALRRQLIAWAPRRILMLSCNPATWVRDATALVDNGYSLGHLELADLFPSTSHVEVISVLERP